MSQELKLKDSIYNSTGGIKAEFHTSLTLTLGKNGWSVLYIIPKEVVPNSYWIEGQVGSRNILDTVIENIKIPVTSRNLQSRPYMVVYCLKRFITRPNRAGVIPRNSKQGIQ
jgi:hypothetical protein